MADFGTVRTVQRVYRIMSTWQMNLLPTPCVSAVHMSGTTFPEDHRSSHDTWVESITISEPSSGGRHEHRGLEIYVRRLVAYHDGTIDSNIKDCNDLRYVRSVMARP